MLKAVQGGLPLPYHQAYQGFGDTGFRMHKEVPLLKFRACSQHPMMQFCDLNSQINSV